MEPKGTLWIEQFYDYCDSDRPGHMNWMEYKPGYAFNGNSLLDITDHRGGSIQFKVDVWYDGDSNGSGNEGIFIDNWKIYKATNESYPYPDNFSVSYDELESNEESEGLNVVSMAWDDLNESGEFQVNYDSGDLSDWDYFNLEDLDLDCDDECDYYSGSEYLVAGQSEVDQIALFNHQDSGSSVKIAGFNSIANIYNHEPIYEQEVQLVASGWNNINVEGWDFDGPFIIARSFNNEQLSLIHI